MVIVHVWLILLAAALAGVGVGALLGKQFGYSLFIGTSVFILGCLPICMAFLGMAWGIAHFETVVIPEMDFTREFGYWEIWIPASISTFVVAVAWYSIRIWIESVTAVGRSDT